MLLRELVDLKPGTMIHGLTVKPSHLGRVASFSVDGWKNQSEATAYIRIVHVASLELTDADRRHFVYTADQLRKELLGSHPYDQDLIKRYTFPENVPTSYSISFHLGNDIGMYLGGYYLAYDGDYSNEWIIGVKILLANGSVAFLRGAIDQSDADDYNDGDGIISATSLKSFGDRQFLLY